MENINKIEWFKETLLIRKESEKEFVEILVDTFDFALRFVSDNVFKRFLKVEYYFRAGGEFYICCRKIVFYIITKTEVKTVVKKYVE